MTHKNILSVKILLIILFSFVFSKPTYALKGQQSPLPLIQCVEAFGSITFKSKLPKNLTKICRHGYLSYFDTKNKIPFLVYYKITPITILGCFPRSENFAEDLSISNSASLDDYKQSIYDRGHMAPSSDLAWNKEAEEESYLMTNISPQLASFNRGLWKSLETFIRNYVHQTQKEHIVIVGTVYNDQDPSIGRGVKIPSAYYKILANLRDRTLTVWYFKHKDTALRVKNLDSYRITLSTLEATLNVQFAELQTFQNIKVKLTNKNIDQSFQQSKKIVCNRQ